VQEQFKQSITASLFTDTNLRETECKDEFMLFKQAVADRIVDSDEELFDDDLESHLRIRLRNLIDLLVTVEYFEDGVHEVLQRVLVEVVDGAEGLK